MDEKYELSSDIVNFLYNGCVAFFPDKFLPEDQKASPAISYSGLDKQTFERKILEITQGKTLEAALQQIKTWKIIVDREGKIHSTVPINIEELVQSYEKKEEKTATKIQEKVKYSIKQAQERTKKEQETKINLKEIRPAVEEINLQSRTPQPTITLTKEQQKIVELAHQDPQVFAKKLEEKIIETSANRNNPLEKESAEIVAKTFTLKLLEIDHKNPQITIDSSPFETLAFFANPENKEFENIIPNTEARNEIAKNSLEALYILEKDSTTAANLVNQALGQDWSSFFIPPQIRKLETTTETNQPQTGAGVNINLTNFLQQIASFQSIEKQIKNTVLDEKTYNQLTKAQRAELEKRIGEAAKKISSASKAINFIRGKKIPSFTFQKIEIQTTNWMDIQLASIGIPTPIEKSFAAMSLNFGDLSSPNILSSPLFNFAFDKFIKKIPVVTKLKSVVSGMTAKLTAKIAAKAAGTKLGAALAANVIPAISQAISIITTLLSLKDIATAIKVWLKENQDKLPFIFAGLMAGGFLLTGAPIYLLIGAGSLGVSRSSSIGSFVTGVFFALTNIVLASLVIPMLIVFIGLPILVATILFIINSGAYVYPPSTKQAALGPGVVVNEYIEVTKVAYAEKHPEKGKSSNLSFENSDLPLEITYEITIKAKKGSLTNISISETCSVTKEKGSPSCPSPSPSIPNGSNITSLDSTSPYVFSYKKTFHNPQFEDTLTIDTINVSAKNAEGETVSSAGSASIKIGNPPEECPNNAWPLQNNAGLNLVTQGPLTPPGCTHENLKQAIDIGVSGETVVATHGGIVTVGVDSCIGKYIKISSSCGSTPFYSLYAHLGAVSVNTGQRVTAGQIIGISDNTGTCTTGDHLHFEFRSNSNIPAVQRPYLIRDIPIGCCTSRSCNP